MMQPKRSFVIGGASSGKSSWAETHAKQLDARPFYIATAQAFDAEMREKIYAHQKQRGAAWDTIEAPLQVAEALGTLPAGRAALLDCATLWLTNHLLAEHDLEAEEAALLAAISACKADLVIVSNEVGGGIVPENALSRRFRAAQGRLNQKLAAQASVVVTVIAGLPLALKGQLP
ncbi:bifunctional adenosylcobinamide kinase/adenosylcobinamide-phosphate guanylyltransferase [Pseudoruegeria sp. SHC-113]|uniref:bifunctional adenosylcobinamide kinase/adenosylcobinamide-phosphate guanylyltransferase n=1 Tax=Pseudoruegeria sp. SHC-113 TaxID=2855439 RepID=UPI0021BA3E2F|nr:bifunctional adenosylcobinamide kinase/adenosylcobinamide-phosphate guanylyltransferase [Pseudoruegeria sp. SHC-113]MCT8161219.1 bifunctional adenosylcobinamide kinase/adenosylcobinamide-phosphate guanylyltransferase [Pseudoruegeria sp. SHC-113]